MTFDLQKTVSDILSSHSLNLGESHLSKFVELAESHADVQILQPGKSDRDVVQNSLFIVANIPENGDLERLLEHVDNQSRLIIIGSEQPGFDSLKEHLFDHGSMGNAPETGPQQIWWGSKTQQDSCPGLKQGEELPVIISFYTEDTPYEDEAGKLIASLEALNLEYQVEGIPHQGSWEKNCSVKSGFIYEIWKKLKKAVLWVDADAVVLRKPTLLANIRCDFAIHKVWRWVFSSGTVYFNYSKAAGKLLQNWTDKCIANPKQWDQFQLDLAWEDTIMQHPLDTLWLPQSYTRIYDFKVEEGEDASPVIEHHQASRTLKKEMTEGKVQPVPSPPQAHRDSRKYCRPVV